MDSIIKIQMCNIFNIEFNLTQHRTLCKWHQPIQLIQKRMVTIVVFTEAASIYLQQLISSIGT